MQYFARISVQHRPANQLQQYLMAQVEKLDNILIEDPNVLFKQIESVANQAAYTYRRCTRLTPRINKDYKTKEVDSITAMGLFTISLHKVAGHFPPIPEAQTVTAAQTEPAPPAPEPAPAPISSQPRQEIWESRGNQKVLRLAEWDQFTPDMQTLLGGGRIWGIYENVLGQVIAEEYGGKTHPLNHV